MIGEEVIEIFKKTGALLEGHFILTSGYHSPHYFQCAKVLQYPEYMELICSHIADHFSNYNFDTVISPAVGGILVGQEVARQLGLRFIFVEKEQGKLALRRGFQIPLGEKILVVEDVVTKGGRVQETLDIVHEHGGQVVGVAMAVDRSGGTVGFGVPMFSLIALQVETFDPDKLPSDLAKIPAVKPGSK